LPNATLEFIRIYVFVKRVADYGRRASLNAISFNAISNHQFFGYAVIDELNPNNIRARGFNLFRSARIPVKVKSQEITNVIKFDR